MARRELWKRCGGRVTRSNTSYMLEALRLIGADQSIVAVAATLSWRIRPCTTTGSRLNAKVGWADPVASRRVWSKWNWRGCALTGENQDGAIIKKAAAYFARESM